MRELKQSWVAVQTLKDSIQKKVYHSYLNKKLQDLDINPVEVGVFQILLIELGIEEEKIQPYVTALSLVKTALDLHETVDKEQYKKTQMIILAGDLYSGYYYQLLSHIQEVGLVREIALGIKETNMVKIKILKEYENKNKFPFLLFKEIETAIISKICRYVGKLDEVQAAADVLYVNRLIREYKQEFTKATIYQSCFSDEQVLPYYQELKREIEKELVKMNEILGESSPYGVLQLKLKEQWEQCK